MVRKEGKESLTRDDLISRARYGEITPEQAEAEAASRGWLPFANEPQFPAFDPMQESRWSLVMALAWIAWRDWKLVRENSAAFRAESTYWIFREWNEPVQSGTAFTRREGWFLEEYNEPTTIRLLISESCLAAAEATSTSQTLTLKEAEQALWTALSDCELVAEAINSRGVPIEVPKGEWPYLKIFEEGKRDVLKFQALDSPAAYRDVKLRRHDLLRLWPNRGDFKPFDFGRGYLIDDAMIEPIASPGTSGYAPLCTALHWIMSLGGSREIAIDDEEAWSTAVRKLFPLIHSGQIEIIGVPGTGGLAQRIEGNALSTVEVIPPLRLSAAHILGEVSYVSCSVFTGWSEWRRQFNDQLQPRGARNPAWTHLQVFKETVLKHFPRPEPKAIRQKDCRAWLLEQMLNSPMLSPKPKSAFRKEAKVKFPGLRDRQFSIAWTMAVQESGATGWSKSGRRRKE